MSYNFNFKREHPFQHRLEESGRVLAKYPDRRPIICDKSNLQHDLPNIDKKKYLVPYELSMAQFIYVIRKRMHLRPEESIFLFVNGQIISGHSIIGQVYETSRDPDGFLYIQYSKENVFGN